MSYLYPLLILLLGVRSSATGNDAPSEDSRTPISLLVLGPYPDTIREHNPDWTAGPALIPAVRLAAARINNRSDILPGYKLQLLEGDSGCNILIKTAMSIPPLFHAEKGHVVGIIGPGCSEAAAFIGDIAAKESVSLIQIGIAASPVLTDTVRFNNTFRMLTSSLQYVDLFAKLIESNRDLNGWETVAALYDGERQYFLSIFKSFVNSTQNNPDINIGFSSSLFNFYLPLNEIELKYKIVFVFAGATLASNLLCLAYHFDPPLLYPVYQWIFHGRTEKNFIKNITFINNGVNYSCSSEQMAEALQGVILNQRNLDGEDRVTLLDLNHEEFKELYKSYWDEHISDLQLPNSSLNSFRNGSDWANAYYDATWAFVLSLNMTLDTLGPQSLHNYSYGDPSTTSVIKSHLKKVTFEGLLGKVSFHEDTQDSHITTNIYQFFGEKVLIGHYSNSSLHLIGNGKFVAGKFLNRVVSIHPAAAYVFLSLTILTLVFISILHTIYIICSNEKSIKAVSPNLSHLMFSGCYLLILLSASITVSSTDWIVSDPEAGNQAVIAGVICNTVYWKLFIGISLIMGSLCVQLWRLYRIFNHFLSKRIMISDTTLALCVLLLVCINVIILTIWTLVDPMLIQYEHDKTMQKSGNPQDDPVMMIRGHCHCKYLTVWEVILFGISLLVTVCVVVLSSLNRRIDRRYFKTTKSVNVMVYVINMLLMLCIGLGFDLEWLDIHYKFILWEVSFLGVVCVVCIFFFLPPTLPIFRRLIQDSNSIRILTTITSV